MLGNVFIGSHGGILNVMKQHAEPACDNYNVTESLVGLVTI